MIKYVNNILSKFTSKQRILALTILLISIILMTNGTELIKSIKGTPDDIKNTINSQQTQINQLQDETKRLNNQIILNQKECTNQIIEREKQFSIEVQKIIDLAKKPKSYHLYSKDTIQLESSTKPKTIDNNMELIINKLNSLKNSLNK